ncbi:hypothetical protein ACIBG7_18785 [Nonomuraea sp. NPDC050328]|uniref:hypothetical protein n=1 Tax=Nonomuraea sp. NPDC050328 TaxID=3364361 RepID=UPI0037B78C73
MTRLLARLQGHLHARQARLDDRDTADTIDAADWCEAFTPDEHDTPAFTWAGGPPLGELTATESSRS